MSYAIRNDGAGWRAVNSADDVGPDEHYSTAPPAPIEKSVEDAAKEAIAAVRAARKPVFYTLAGMQSEALTKGDAATANAIADIQQAMKDLPDTDLSACTNAAEVNAAFVAAWLAIAQSAPANVVSAFNEVLA